MNRLTDDLKQNVFTARSTVNIQTLFTGMQTFGFIVDHEYWQLTSTPLRYCFNSHQYDKIVNVNMKKV